MTSIDDIIETYEQRFGLEVNPENRAQYFEFLNRQLKAHDEYKLDDDRSTGGRAGGKMNLAWTSLLADKLLLFSYVIGETPIIVDSEGSEQRIGKDQEGNLKAEEDRAKDLTLLSLYSMGVQTVDKKNRTDQRLRSLYFKMYHRKGRTIVKEHWQNWSSLINEIGKDSVVKKYFGRKISYVNVRLKGNNHASSVK